LNQKELKELMPELGDLLYVHAQRMGFSDPREDVSVIWDLAVHEVSALLYLLGTKPSRVKAYGHDFSANGVKDFVSLKMLFPGHVAAHVDITWWYPQKVRRMVIAGKKAMAIWDDQEAEYKLQLHKKWVEDGARARLGRVSLISVPSCEPLRKELQHFIECCEKRKPPLTDGRNGLAVTGVVLGLVVVAPLALRLLPKLLFGIHPLDVVSFLIVSLLMLGVAILANWLPARRTALLDPVRTLRNE